MKSSKVPAWACTRCETYEGVDSKSMTLLGGLSTRLCEKCENAWHELCQLPTVGHPDPLDRLSQINMETLALLGLCHAGQDKRTELEALHQEALLIKKFFYATSKVFMGSGKPEAEAKEAAEGKKEA